MRLFPHSTITIAITAMVIPVSEAHAEGFETFFFGGEAALTGGAVSAVTDDAGAIHYNPAGLAGVERDRVSLTGVNLTIRRRCLDEMLQARLGENHATGAGCETGFRAVPTGLGYAHAVREGLGLGGGVFITERDETELWARLPLDLVALGLPAASLPAAQLALFNDLINIKMGGALGLQVGERLRIGFSLFGTVAIDSSRVVFLREGAGTDGSSGEAGEVFDVEHSNVSFGGYAVLGLQWQISERWRLGIVWRTSAVQLFRRVEVSSPEVFEALSPIFARSTSRDGEHSEELQWSYAQVATPRLRLGLAYVTSRGWAGLEGEISPPRHDAERGIDDRLLWDIRAGGLIQLNERLSLGGGLFTRQTRQREPQGVLNPSLSFYGATFGVRSRSTFRLARGSRQRVIYLETTTAFRYALGVGQAIGLRYDPWSVSAAETQRGASYDIFHHIVSFYVSTGLFF